MIVSPEEAESLIPLVRDARTTFSYLLTYATPVTRKMLHFDDLDYYTMPDLPTGWQAPTRLKIELGIFAGRLYFEFNEYSDLREYLGLGKGSAELAETIDDTVTSAKLYGTEEAVDDITAEAERDTGAEKAQSFTTRPLTFLQEWLAVRRKGQDFTHTPMGHVCQGKPLTASHPFFTRRENDGTLKPDGAATKMDLGKGLSRGASNVDEVSVFGAQRYDGDDDDDDNNDDEDIDYYDGEDDTGTIEEGESVWNAEEVFSNEN